MLTKEFRDLLNRLDGQTLELVTALLTDASRQDGMWDGHGLPALQTRVRLKAAEKEVEARMSAPWVDPHPEETEYHEEEAVGFFFLD
jgi:hypothetical protein